MGDREDEIGLHEEGAQGMLEGGDGTVGMGEGGLKMKGDMGGGAVRGRQVWRRTESSQSGADVALGQAEALPEALPGAVGAAAVGDGANGSGDAGGDGELEETPESVGGETEAADFVGRPDAEGASATATCVAVAAKNTACPQGFVAGLGLVVADQMAVANQGANDVAMRTRGLFELLGKREPFVVVAVKA
jgi:hypothetical protein